MACGLLMVARLQAADPIKVVSPASFQDKEGEGQSTVLGGGPGTDIRFQQFYRAANFTGSAPNGGYIKEISFRTDGPLGGSSLAAVLTHVEIHLGYAGGFNQISREYAKNEGPGYLLVYSGSLQIPATRSGQYDVSLVLQTPFYYNPQAGNLMLDYVNFGFGALTGPYMDRTDLPSETATLYGGRFSFEGIGVSAGGLITRFSIDAVPEPGSAALFVLGGVILAVVRRRSEP